MKVVLESRYFECTSTFRCPSTYYSIHLELTFCLQIWIINSRIVGGDWCDQIGKYHLSSNTYLFISDFKNLVTYVCTICFSKNISNENKLGKMYCKLYLIITLYWRQNSAKCFETAHTYLLAWFIYWNVWVHKGILFESWRELSIVCHLWLMA